MFIAPLYGIIDVYTRTPKRRGGLDPPVVILIIARNRPHLPRGARAAPGRGWRLSAGACLQKRVQSRACAPPQGPPTRSPPITRDPTIPLVAAHTLTRVGGPKPPRHGPSLHTAKTSTKLTSVVSSRLHILSTHLARHHPARQPSGSAQGLGGTPGGVVETAEQRHFCKRSSRRREEW